MNKVEEKVSINKLLEKKNGKKELYIKGTRISANFIARYWRLGIGAEKIISEYPHIPPAGVYAALAYYFANREVLDAEINAEIEMERLLNAEYNQFKKAKQKEAA